MLGNRCGCCFSVVIERLLVVVVRWFCFLLGFFIFGWLFEFFGGFVKIFRVVEFEFWGWGVVVSVFLIFLGSLGWELGVEVVYRVCVCGGVVVIVYGGRCWGRLIYFILLCGRCGS